MGSETQDRPRIWITGARGLIGHQLARWADELAPDHEVIPLARQDLDLTDRDAVGRRLAHDQPILVFHCAGLTRGPACEADPALAYHLNVEVTRHLLEDLRDAVFVYFSTDLVFDGMKGGYTEEDEPLPRSVYAQSKVDAEQAVLRSSRHVVLRTSLNYGASPTGDRSFHEDMLLAVRAGAVLRLFTDEYRSPIPAEVTARAAWEIGRAALGLAGADRHASGLFHVAGAERLSRWEIGERLAAVHPELRGRIERASLVDYQGAPRSPDTSLDCSKAQGILSFRLPRFTDWLRRLEDPLAPDPCGPVRL